jgi:hypothetical protein
MTARTSSTVGMLAKNARKKQGRQQQHGDQQQ